MFLHLQLKFNDDLVWWGFEGLNTFSTGFRSCQTDNHIKIAQGLIWEKTNKTLTDGIGDVRRNSSFSLTKQRGTPRLPAGVSTVICTTRLATEEKGEYT